VVLVCLAAFVTAFGLYALYFGMAWGFGWLPALPIILIAVTLAAFFIAAARGIWHS
jgi:hypothetical protein